ncbi:HAMP domain-containing histidine kinase [Aneurinibacillus sp. Ricciae_BoGa-3]|uniref:HAMP domain-containing sensor histidine kinase n=1 Tax=Aneurinibacillus sp. Ricciae_BoGa-3 TaxID=3022697 RepID=UPI00234281B7|nr:HAMP domain-containing histidine kinase [Aneurinibacillus sp. Ricciae_BoGa-3]WCK52554.1 HAMP domain-containing histidine kinase [Aneurinibacillus sp. Ricciae_BoGa-3]
MSFKVKISLYTSILVICILILVNFIIYFLFIKITTANEKEMLVSKADNVVENVQPSILLTQHKENLLQTFLPDNSMIRVVDKEGDMVNQLTDDLDVTKIAGKFTPASSSDLYSVNGHQILIVRSPIVVEGRAIGTLEMGEKLVSLEGNISTLISLLLFSSLGAVLLTIMSSMLLSKMMLRPLSNMILTMKEIEESLTFKKIRVEEKPQDEIYQLISTFNHMIERLQMSFMKQRQFVSDASHELKTPLTIIESYTNMLLRWGMNDAEVQKEAIGSIHEEAIHMKKLTKQMLDLTSSEQENNLSFHEFDLVELCNNVGKLLADLYNRSIKITPDSPSIMIFGDSLKIKQLLLILIDNALKYSKKAVEIHISQNQKQTIIRVIDYGIGIPKDEIENVFERFYRVDASRARKTGGTGLGLPIAKSIVNQHQGTVEVLSEEGMGTEVIIKLPRRGHGLTH